MSTTAGAKHVAAKEPAQSEFWVIYADFKAYSESPSQAARKAIEQRFNKLCETKTGYEDLNEALRSLHTKKESFLMLQDRPGQPLHNNLSERYLGARAATEESAERRGTSLPRHVHGPEEDLSEAGVWKPLPTCSSCNAWPVGRERPVCP